MSVQLLTHVMAPHIIGMSHPKKLLPALNKSVEKHLFSFRLYRSVLFSKVILHLARNYPLSGLLDKNSPTPELSAGFRMARRTRDRQEHGHFVFFVVTAMASGALTVEGIFQIDRCVIRVTLDAGVAAVFLYV
jgi:hypothetical protein